MSFRNRRDAKRSFFITECEKCGFDDFVTRHRIKPGRKGGKYTPDNVVILCPNCHILAELKKLPEKELYDIISNRKVGENIEVNE